MSVAIRGLAFALLALSAVGCATGGKDGNQQPADASLPRDSSQVAIDAPRSDAGVMVDAFVMIDAAPVMTPDAGPGGICADNAGCTFPGECCFTLGGGAGICTPGDVILDACFP
ncbi:MAG: hypothetical protein JWP01_4154 [Myxococcales bacterium]|nr:hypothetical protein [Myxococcales bacterium]